ncbi:MAG TPA: TRAP transporter large permease [Candidatus Methylomirabilis sp.]|nr:TRAP transporter large permease [Candidatus Methylomirabilis sp.]
MILPLVLAFVALLTVTVPVSVAMGLAAAIAILWGGKAPINTVVTQMVSGMDSFPLMAIPFFILAGELMERAGISERLVHLAKAFVGHIRGGLGMVVLVGEYLFSGISGSTAADISAIGSLLIAPMERAGYSKGQAVAIVSAATAMGILVPPCIFMIVLASMTNQSIGAMFVAGFLPAIVIAIGLGGYIYWEAGVLNIPREAKASRRERLRALGDGVIAMVMPGIIFGAIFGGITTVTEAAVIAVLYSAFVGLAIYKRFTLKDLPKIILASTINTSMCMLLIGAATVFSWVMTVERVPQIIAKLVMGVSTSPWFFLLLSNVIFVVFGAVLEGLPAMIVFVPVMYPIAVQFGIDPLHYGILIIASIGIGVFLPPIGVALFIACAIAKLNIVESAKFMAPYLVILFLGLLVVTYVPWFTLVLPHAFLK